MSTLTRFTLGRNNLDAILGSQQSVLKKLRKIKKKIKKIMC